MKTLMNVIADTVDYNLKDVPSYYVGEHKGIEAMDVVLDFQHDNYNLGTALTYIMRAGKKPGNPMSQDIIKAIVHLKRELNHQKQIELNEGSNTLSKHIPEGESVSQEYWYSTRTDKDGQEPRTDQPNKDM